MMDKKDLNLIFIGGTGRSGTNITKKILSLNSQVETLPFEYRFSIDPFGIIDTYLSLKYNWTPYNAHAKIRQMETVLNGMGKRSITSYFGGKVISAFDSTGKKITPPPYYEWEMEKWFPGYYDQLRTLIKDLTDFEYNSYWPGENRLVFSNYMRFISYDKNLICPFRKFFRLLFENILAINNKEYFVDDNTWNLLYAKEISEILPEAKFVHLVRDPRDVVASLRKQRWTPNDLIHVIEYYSSIMDKILNVQSTFNSLNYLEIKLEDLVSDKRNIIELISDFVGIKVEKDMLNVDLKKSNSGRFKKEFSVEEQKLLSEKLSKYMIRYKYKTGEEDSFEKP